MIGIIDYGLGNLASVANALSKLEIPFTISSNLNVLKNAKALILPGVGAAGQGIENLKTRQLDGLIIEQAKKGTPILGICLGMQLLMDWSEEGDVKCLGLVKGKVRKFVTDFKVPQIGWNQVRYKKSKINPDSIGIKNQKYGSNIKNNKLFKNILNNSNFYFVNSYYCIPEEQSVVAGLTDYGKEFCSIFEKDNIVGVQFHPEKSGQAGFKLLKNFIDLC